MKNVTLFSCLAYIALCAFTSKDGPTPMSVDNGDKCLLLNCDTIVNIDGYYVRLIRDNGEDVFSGLNIFTQEMKESVDKELLEKIETDLYKLSLQKSDAKDVMTKIVKGKLADFKSVTPETSCTVKTSNAKTMMAQWSINGKTLEVTIPVSYETAKGNNRSETENLLIKKIKQSNGKRESFQIEKTNLEAYGEDLFVLPGGSYQNKYITNNIYIDSNLVPVWDIKYPNESLANIFIFPSEKYGDIIMELTVLKHEYGEKETLAIPVLNLLSEMEKEGCIAFWGVEGMKNGILEGALFFYNPKQGYDHVLKIECNPEDVIKGDGKIKARASLYIPTNNVDNLNAPYLRKSEKERIKYEN